MSRGARGKPLQCVSPVGLFRTNTDGKCISVNSRWCEISGLTAAEALDEGWARALHPDDRERVLEEWRRATREAAGLETEFRFRRRDGAVTQVLAQALPEQDTLGRITGFAGAITDLSRYLADQKELRANQERVALALGAVTEGSWNWDIAAGTVLVSRNRPFGTGHPPGEAEMPVRVIAERIHPEDRACARDRMMAHLASGAPLFECEHRLLSDSGAWRWTLLRGRVVERDGAGNPLRVVGVGIDIESRKQAETEIAERSEQLRRLALELALAQEYERRRIAAGLHDEVGQMLALARVKLGQLVESGASGDVPGRAGEICALVDRAIEETHALTFELSSPVLRELGLTAAIESLCEQLGKESGIHFRVVAEREPDSLGEDLGILLFRAVRGLCQNIVKHARAPRAEVRLSSDSERVQIVVADDGNGFDASEQARHFDRAGGFGLFAIREMCAQVGGTYAIESSVGKGARVVLTVPFG